MREPSSHTRPANPDEVWEGFLRAVVRIDLGDVTWTIEPRAVGDVGTFPLPEPVHIITAYNPAGHPSDLHENRRCDAELGSAVAGRVHHRTIGSAPDGSMAEPGYAVAGLDRASAISLGRRFGQRAIYEWGPSGLDVLGVDEPSSHRAGWRLTRDEVGPRPTPEAGS